MSFGQNSILYSSKNIRLNINTNTNKYCVWEKPKDESNRGFVTRPDDISEGIIFTGDSLIICTDTITNEKIILKIIDKYRLIVINENRFFKTKETFYAIKISDSQGNTLERMGWRDGKQHGLWLFYSDKGIDFVVYENGEIIKRYFKTYKELDTETRDNPAIL